MAKEALPKILVTDREDAPADKSVLRTPSGEPNVRIVAMSMVSQAGIRALRTFLQSLVGFILAVGTGAAGAVGINVPAGDFVALVMSSASLAVAPAAISLIQNAIEILTKLDSSTPQMRA